MKEKNKMPGDIRIIRSDRKTIGLEINTELQVVLRVPRQMTEAEIYKFIKDRSEWIQKNLEKMKTRVADTEPPFSREEIEIMAGKALKDIPERVHHYAPLVGVTYGQITIRNQRTRWGSCSSKGNLNFNCLLMMCPEKIRDYVVVHELCHRKEMNHSKSFWNEVGRILPDYKEREKWLKENGTQLIRRMSRSG